MDKTKLNPYFQQLTLDYLYHLGLDSSMDLAAQFGDIKNVILTRSFHNADLIADRFIKRFYKIKNLEITSKPIAKDERYHLHKVHNSLIISHGIGTPSLLICLNEVVKLLWHSKAEEVKFFRVGPSGGLGVEPMSIVIASEAVTNTLESVFYNIELAEKVAYPAPLDQQLSAEVANFAQKYSFEVGKVIGGMGFYDNQARLNGAMPLDHSLAQRNEYLQRAYAAGVRGFDMESLGFAGFCHHLAIPACEVNAVLVNRFKSDMIELAKDQQIAALLNAADLVIDYILNV